MRFILTILFTISLCQSVQAKKKPAGIADRALSQISETLIPPPAPDEVCFSPEGHCDIKLWKFIQSATQSLDIAVFDITHDKIAHEIAVASKKIPVRLLVDRRQAKGPHSVVSTLIKAGVEVRYGYQRGIMHNKFSLVDGTRLQTGSFNYTDGASSKNNENQVYLNQPNIVRQYIQRFEGLWRKAKPASTQLSRKSEQK